MYEYPSLWDESGDGSLYGIRSCAPMNTQSPHLLLSGVWQGQHAHAPVAVVVVAVVVVVVAVAAAGSDSCTGSDGLKL